MLVTEYLATHPLLFDGAMGTMLQKNGLPIGGQPEYFNLSHPDIVQKIHEEYVQAGCDVVSTNTFQANGTKIPSADLPEIIAKGVALAKAAHPKFVAYDMGPIGQLLAPVGTLSFEAAYDYFKEQACLAEAAGADLILIETMSDLFEMKAAILAVKEHTQLPVFATMTFQEDQRTFLGTDAVTATLTLQGLGVAALGVNCSLGPAALAPIVKEMLRYAKVPVIVQANAGLPEMRGGTTYFPTEVKEYTAEIQGLLAAGVRIIGGCCGTTPAYIANLRNLLDESQTVTAVPREKTTAITSGATTVHLNQQLSVIGERLNPTGKKRLKEAIVTEDMTYIFKEALQQVNAGADILDVNVGLPEIDEAAMMKTVVTGIQEITTVPLQIDSSSIPAIEAGCRYYNGKPLLNSVNGKEESMAAIFPIAKKYGAVVLGLCLDEAGIPETAAGRVAIAKKIIQRAAEYGIEKADIMIDPLVLTASAQQEQVQVTLDTLRLLKDQLGVCTVAGVSNVSFGLPERETLTSHFLAAAVGAGLDAPILNPLSPIIANTITSLKVINGQDKEAKHYIANSRPVVLTEKTTTNKADEGIHGT